MTTVIEPGGLLALWSAPRCRSTAFLRMMAERGDVVVVHEPFSHVADFGEATVGDRRVRSEAEVIRALTELARDRWVFFKDTTDFHYPVLLGDEAFLRAARHAFLIRTPREAIVSHVALNPQLQRDEVGFGRLYEIYTRVRAVTGKQPAVMDAEDLVTAPHSLVAQYCARVGIDFRPEALSWQPGSRPEWRRAQRWHQEVAASTGLGSPTGPRRQDLEADPTLHGYLRYHQPFYERLRAVRIRVGYAAATSAATVATAGDWSSV